MIRTSTLSEAIENGYVVYNRKSGYKVAAEFAYHQEVNNLPIVKVYTKSAYASITVDPIGPLSEETGRRVVRYLQQKDKHVNKPFSLQGMGNYGFICASMIPIKESIEVAKQVVLLLNGKG